MNIIVPTIAYPSTYNDISFFPATHATAWAPVFCHVFSSFSAHPNELPEAGSESWRPFAADVFCVDQIMIMIIELWL